MTTSTTPGQGSPSGFQRRLDAAPMRGLQWRAVALCFLMNVIDGIDVLTMAFTASAVAKDWMLTPVTVGWLLSAGIIGMTIGSVFVAPLADRWGRRPLVIACLVAAGTFMVLAEWAGTPTSLGVLRLLTGIAIGGVLVSANVLTSEYSNARWRALAIGLQSVGFALGATLGGLLASYLLSHGSWRDVFVWGGVLTWLTAVAVAIGLPESLDQLLQARKSSDRPRLVALLKRMGHEQLVPFVESHNNHVSRGTRNAGAFQNLGLLFAPGATRIWALGGCFFCVMCCFYFVTSWTPRLLEHAGLSAERGLAGGVLLHVGGMIGALLMGLMASRWPLQRVAFAFITLGVLAMCAVVPAMGWTTAAAVALGICLGLFLNGTIAALYTTAPQTFDASCRSGGVGIVLAFGRLGGMASPVVAGHLMQREWQVAGLYGLYAGILVVAALLLLAFARSGSAAPANSARLNAAT